MTDKKTEALKLALELALDVRANASVRLATKAIALTGVLDAALAEQPSRRNFDGRNSNGYQPVGDISITPNPPPKNPSADQPAQPAQQKPVAVIKSVVHSGDGGVRVTWLGGFPQIGDLLYTSPPASKPWVGLTEKEKRGARNSVSYSPLAMTMGEWTEAVQDATESKLKEKNNG